jgi:predicted aspartyl protease
MLSTLRPAVFSILVSCVIAVHGQENTARVPMELRQHLPTVPVVVNGQGPFHFAIDTGAGGSLLVSASLSRRLGLAVIGEDDVTDPTGAGRQKVPAFRVESVKLGEIEFDGLRADQLVELGKEGNLDGILGFPLFREYLLTLDYPKQQVVLSRGELPPADGNDVVSFRMPNSVPEIDLSVGGRQIAAHIDSGGMGLSLPEKVSGGLAFTSQPMVLGRGRTVSNDFEITGAQLGSDIRLGQYTFSKPFVEINPVLPIAVLGAIPLEHFAVTFDQKNLRVRFVASEKTISLAPPQFRGPIPQAAGAESPSKP